MSYIYIYMQHLEFLESVRFVIFTSRKHKHRNDHKLYHSLYPSLYSNIHANDQ